MAEFRDLALNQDTVNVRENDAVVPDDFPNQLSLDVIQNLELGENVLEVMNDRSQREENYLLLLTFELKDATIRLLELQLKLLDLKHKKFKRQISKVVDGLNDIILKFRISSKGTEIDDKHNLLQEKLEELTMAKKELEDIVVDVPECKDDEDKFLNEMHGDFLTYKVAYNKCVLHIENFLRKAENKNISDVPRESQEELCVLFSVLEENVDTYNTILLSSKEEFNKFELIFKNDLESSSQVSDDRINLFITAIKNAELAYINLKPISFDILHFDCATRGNF